MLAASASAASEHVKFLAHSLNSFTLQQDFSYDTEGIPFSASDGPVVTIHARRGSSQL